MTATPSFRSFDYRVRPAKNAERRMLCEAFRRLSFFEPVENYRYIGFGATTFVDFILVHRTLAIEDMISIENRVAYEARFEFNIHFHCVKMRYGSSNQVLPELTWEKRAITWLDYEGHLTQAELRDIAYVTMSAASGCILIVTVNVGNYPLPTPKPEDVQQYRLEKLKEDVGSEKVPGDIEGKHVEGWVMAQTFRRIIMNEIDQVLSNRNGLRSAAQRMRYQQLFHFHYQDQARMLTVGGVFYEDRDQVTLQQCQFETLDFVRLDDVPYVIKVPVLTPRERQYLDKKLPQGEVREAGEEIGLTPDEVQDYARLYRYCPMFVDVELS